DIVARDAENVYGSGFYRNLSQDLKAAIPESEGFSRQNLQYMKKMYLLYSELSANCQQPVGNSDAPICQQPVGTSLGINDDIFNKKFRAIPALKFSFVDNLRTKTQNKNLYLPT
ncbi:MAG: hypothetical protein K2L59_02465, partial [Muribaculaceae bacterium]|nr:hypothetical protein [Muribaculaceae bacterium]